MGAKNSVAKILTPPKKKEDYMNMFPLDRDLKVYNAATAEFEQITSKKKTMTKDQFMKSQASRFAGMDPHLLGAIWNAFDADGNGVMDVNEFRLYHAVNAVGSNNQRAMALFAVTDTSNDRVLQQSEIVSMMILARKFKKRAAMDAPPTGAIDLTADEVLQVTKDADAFMERHDKDKSKSVEIDEFMKGWQDQAFADFNFFDSKVLPEA